MCVCGRSTRARCAECDPGRRLRSYELAVRDVLESCDATGGFAWNKRIHGTRLRPDFAWVFSSGCVVLEVDERSHASYPPDEERARERRIAQTLGRRVFFFRLRIAPNAPVEHPLGRRRAGASAASRRRVEKKAEPP